MRDPDDVFHLAIPCADLDETEEFYHGVMGCEVGRRYDDRVTFDFFGDQLVCHLAPDEVPDNVTMYPRHFGVTFHDREDFDALIERCQKKEITFWKEPFVRFEGDREEHRTFFLCDPANNLLEFKHYQDPEMMY